MASLHDDGEVGFEEGMLLLPSNVLDEACDSNNKEPPETSATRLPPQTSKGNTVTGGPGMQAVFLVSGQGSCGTGVFLPQKAGTKSTRKPACAPVLLPARVVHALNLKVHEFGLQISPSQGPKYGPRNAEVYTSSESTKKKNDQKEGIKQCSVISQSQTSSPDIFLPKEWTY
ncbi:unnamed protein product [Sphenostylis stenocarpa]|uniref:Uncharacterized protein n=1 Tax=Sphenostylis stenocarpa TaxID=92480 RepID=A0AA86VAL2_9FABA|nr:unnamed protein product [Sphenostylis stenocarpa]